MTWCVTRCAFARAGYEKYNTVRADPALCFLERVGRPDEKAIAAEQRANDFMDGYVAVLLLSCKIQSHLHPVYSISVISIQYDDNTPFANAKHF